MFRKVDCIRLHVSDLSTAIEFYGSALGHELVWRKGDNSAGLQMRDSDTEIVLVREPIKPEVDLLVDSVEGAVAAFEKAGGKVVVRPFNIAIGKCAVVQDPWGNSLVMLDTTKGILKTDAERNVIP